MQWHSLWGWGLQSTQQRQLCKQKLKNKNGGWGDGLVWGTLQ